MKNNTSQYFSQLDSLRAIAVLMVIISHWFSKEHFLNRYTANGVNGVTLFFVLSGFLITGILLKSKHKVEEGSSIRKAFKVFYMRRSLRIFPVYYLLLFVLLVLNLSSVRVSFWWHFFYASNFYFWIKDAFAGSLSHLWSLAVEEQFYLVWPAIILLVTRRFLTYVLLTGVLAGVLFRLVMVTDLSDMGRLLMPGSLDSFCIGGLFAYGRSNMTSWYKYYLAKQQWFILLAFVLIVIVHLPAFRMLSIAQFSVIYFLFISIAFGILINRVSYNIEIPFLKQILNNKGLLYIGKISYGIYLFHNFIPNFYGLSFSGIPSFFSIYLTQLLRLVVLLFLYSLSWFLVEEPLLVLKHRFEYK
jgi:peptidoglycan/LPS O-acetylase OafA/YrhL